MFYRFILPYWTNTIINFSLVGKLAHASAPYRNVFVTASSWLVVALTIDRFILIKIPTKSSVLSTCKRTYIVIVVISVLSVAVNIPYIYDMNELPPVINSCTGHWRFPRITREDNSTYTPFRSQKSYQLTKLVFSSTIDYILPVIVISILNTVTIKSLRAKRKIGSESSRVTRRRQADLKLTKMIITVSVIFMICALPDIVLKVIRQFLEAQKLLKALPIVQIFLMINVAANFVVYCLFNKHLFGALKTLCEKYFKCAKEVKGINRATTITRAGAF